MKFEVIVIGRYEVPIAVNERDAKDQALHHFEVALLRWADGMDSAAQMFDIRVTNLEKDSKDSRVYTEESK